MFLNRTPPRNRSASPTPSRRLVEEAGPRASQRLQGQRPEFGSLPDKTKKQRHERPTCGGRPIDAHCVITAVKPATFTVDAPTDNWGCAGSTRTTRAQGTTNAHATSRSTSDARPPQCCPSAVKPTLHRHDVQLRRCTDPDVKACHPSLHAGETRRGNPWRWSCRRRPTPRSSKIVGALPLKRRNAPKRRFCKSVE